MKKAFLIFAIVILLFSGCHSDKVSDIVATTLPVYEFASTLCHGTDITVSRLITENVSCLHDYSVQVSQMQAVESAQVVILSGAGLEDFLDDILQNANCIIDASCDVEFHEGHTHEHGDHHHEVDPHIWLSPEIAKQMSRTIAYELSAIYPEHAEVIQQNLSDLLGKLNTLQIYGENKLKDLSCSELITFHDGFGYFAESFHLNILSAVEEESGSEASAKMLVSLIEQVKTNHLPAIFTETNGSTAAAEIIASETGAKIYSLDMAMSGNDYFAAMYHNIDTIKEALG